MVDFPSLAATALAFFVVAVSPGPATLSNATLAMSRGRRTSLIYAAGLSCGLVFWGLVAASGMGAVLQGSHRLLMVLKVIGGLYLLWLAFQCGRTAWRPGPSVGAEMNGSGWFLRGLLLNLSNPKTVIAWMAALSVGLSPEDGIGAVAVMTAVCIAVGFVVNALYSVLFSIPGVMHAYRRGRRWIDGAAGVLFSLAGFGLIRSAFSR